ncbi:MAG: class I SAM-dependent methyltransferase [Mariprofundaceae bacterium]|nr:class I SAM-dependent methyltransferase [Mariprofundaceae bacterium]
MVLVDPWSAAYGAAGCSQTWHDGNYAQALITLAPYRPRAAVLRITSMAAVQMFDDAAFDFVLLDADHSRQAVARDCAAWWRTIRPGGWLGGRHYQRPMGGRDRLWGIRTVKEGVDDFLNQQNTQGAALVLELPGTSWRIVKNQ